MPTKVQHTYLVLFKGDDSDFIGNQNIVLNLETDLDLTGCKAHFKFLDFAQDFTEIPENKQLELVFPKAQTAKFPLGAMDAELWLEDSEGKRRTVSNRIHIVVTNSVYEAYNNKDTQAITVTIESGSGGGGIDPTKILEGVTMETNTLVKIREAIQTIGTALGATVTALAMMLLPCRAATNTVVQKIDIRNVDLDSPVEIVTNVDCEALVDTNQLHVAVTNLEDKISKATPDNYSVVSNAAMNAVQPSVATNIAESTAASATNALDVSLSSRLSRESQNSTNYTDSAIASSLTNYATRAEMDAGWWSEWTVKRNGADVTTQVSPPSWIPEGTIGPADTNIWFVGDSCISGDEPTSAFLVDGPRTEYVGDLAWNAEDAVGESVSYTATRHRVSAPVPTKPEDIGAASTNDVQLTPVYGGNGKMYSEWVCDPSTNVYGNVWSVDWIPEHGWVLIDAGIDMPIEEIREPENAVELNFPEQGVVATRTENPLIGYTLGSQTNEVLASTNGVADAISKVDTSYRRVYSLTNLNQTVQFIELDETQTSLAIELPTTGDTKDWLVYVYAATNATLTLPSGVTWWTSDAANTNAIEAATPTALYFSQISTNIFMLGRQTMKEVSQ
jgi:hypothetical protein